MSDARDELSAFDDCLFWGPKTADLRRLQRKAARKSDAAGWILLGSTFCHFHDLGHGHLSFLKAWKAPDRSEFLSVELRYRWARALCAEGKVEKAQELVTEALGLSEPGLQRAAVYFRQASIYAMRDDLAGMSRALSLAVDSFPAASPQRFLVSARLLQAQVAVNLGAGAEAREILDEIAPELPATHPKVSWQVGQILNAAGFTSLALRHLEHAAKSLSGLEGARAFLDLLGSMAAEGISPAAETVEAAARALKACGVDDQAVAELRLTRSLETGLHLGRVRSALALQQRSLASEFR